MLKYFILCFLFLYTSAISSQTINIAAEVSNDTTDLQTKFNSHYAIIAGTDNVLRFKRVSLIIIQHLGFDGRIHNGQILCSESVANELSQIFKELVYIKFPIYQARPICYFDFDDEISMEANNTTCFDYRFQTGGRKLSKHASGLAIDINPRQNPYISSKEKLPFNCCDSVLTGRIRYNEQMGRNVVAIFKKYGWSWGGNWKSKKDYMHFEK